MMSPSVLEFDILPANRSDIPRMAQIHVITCEMDNCFKLYFKTTAEFLEKVVAMLEQQVGDPTWHHMKAVDRETGTLTSWASWWTPTDDEIREHDRKIDDEKQLKLGQEHKKKDHPSGSLSAGFSKDFDFPPGLSQHIKQDTDKWLDECTYNRRHILLRGLFTDPLFQRRGMASALVGQGNALADAAALPIFVQASAYRWPVYARLDFKTMQHLDVDLRKWAPGADTNDKGYGVYRFRYMLRLPKTLPMK